MDDAALRSHLEHDGRRFADVLGSVELATPVPACPGWSVQRLADHFGRVHRSVTRAIRDGAAPAGGSAALPHGPEGPAVVDWYVDGFKALGSAIDEFVSAAPDEEVATWAGTRPRRFWLRRMAQEACVHRHDIEVAAGRVTPIDPELATDGIDELFEVFVAHRISPAALEPLEGTSVHLHATDEGPDGVGEWLARADGGRVRWERAHGKGDAAVRGPVADLYLWVWGRAPTHPVEIMGDADVAERWRTAPRL